MKTFSEFVNEKINWKKFGMSLRKMADKQNFKSITMAVINNSSIEATGDIEVLKSFKKLIVPTLTDDMYCRVDDRLVVGYKS